MKQLRRVLRILHRDIGYFIVGLTIIFTISGIAVNHIEDWNPNYSIEQVKKDFKTTSANDDEIRHEVEKLLSHDLRNARFKTAFWESEKVLKLFYSHEHTITVDLQAGQLVLEIVHARFLLRNFNKLHVNEIKGVWTWISDLFALALLFLALSSLFMIKGKKGPLGRGGIYIICGFVIPVVVLYFAP